MKSFETKARDYYGEVVINKGLMSKAGFGARAIPVYVGEWIISQFLAGDVLTDEGREEIIKIVSSYLPFAFLSPEWPLNVLVIANSPSL